jgi:hypothetical protein
MDCGAADGCNAFWSFVARVDWPSRPELADVEAVMCEAYSPDDIKHFHSECVAARTRHTMHSFD